MESLMRSTIFVIACAIILFPITIAGFLWRAIETAFIVGTALAEKLADF